VVVAAAVKNERMNNSGIREIRTDFTSNGTRNEDDDGTVEGGILIVVVVVVVVVVF